MKYLVCAQVQGHSVKVPSSINVISLCIYTNYCSQSDGESLYYRVSLFELLFQVWNQRLLQLNGII